MKSTKVFSLTDWNYHRGKVAWDDLFLDNGRFLATVAVMSLAEEDGLFSEKWLERKPHRVIIHDRDGGYTVYENVAFLTRARIQKLLDDLGKLLHKKFMFVSQTPETLPRVYQNILKAKKEKLITPFKSLRATRRSHSLKDVQKGAEMYLNRTMATI